jgi:DNA repair exonuclease SbcCD ATPase subunit
MTQTPKNPNSAAYLAKLRKQQKRQARQIAKALLKITEIQEQLQQEEEKHIKAQAKLEKYQNRLQELKTHFPEILETPNIPEVTNDALPQAEEKTTASERAKKKRKKLQHIQPSDGA